MAQRQAMPDADPATLAAALPNAHVEAFASPPPPSGTPVGGDLAAVFEGDPLPEATVEPQLTSVAAVVQVTPAPVARVALATPAPEPIGASTEAPVAAALDAAPAPEPVVVASHATLYDAVAAAFPEQPDRAYGVVLCESSGHPGTNTGNGYYGLWQFDLPTWQSVGGAGLPSQATVEEQVRRARMLYERRGWQPWGCATG
jgi:hypothetical protein